MKNTTLKIIIFLLVTLLSASCWETDGMDILYDRFPQPDGDEEKEIADVDMGAVSGDDLSGVWAMKMTMTGILEVYGMVWDISISNLFVAKVGEDKDKIDLIFCDQLTSMTDDKDRPVTIGATKTPDELKAALAKKEGVELPLDNGELKATDFVWTWGVDLENFDISKDDLPKKEDDSKLFDEDKDQNPGITVLVSNPDGERYMARRATWNIADAKVSDDKQWFFGSLKFNIEQEAVKATNDQLMTVAPIQATDDNNSYYFLRRGKIDEEYTCEQLLKDHTGLFNEPPAIK